MVKDVGRVQAKASTKAALDGLKLSEDRRTWRSSAPSSPGRRAVKTRAILKLAGRAAFALTVAAIDLASWIFTALCTAFGFCSAVKRTTERTTERYLIWRRARRARLAAA